MVNPWPHNFDASILSTTVNAPTTRPCHKAHLTAPTTRKHLLPLSLIHPHILSSTTVYTLWSSIFLGVLENTLTCLLHCMADDLLQAGIRWCQPHKTTLSICSYRLFLLEHSYLGPLDVALLYVKLYRTSQMDRIDTTVDQIWRLWPAVLLHTAFAACECPPVWFCLRVVVRWIVLPWSLVTQYTDVLHSGCLYIYKNKLQNERTTRSTHRSWYVLCVLQRMRARLTWLIRCCDRLRHLIPCI